MADQTQANEVEWEPVYALSLARTALDDPLALPDGEIHADGPRAYAIDKIDEVIGALYFEAGGYNDEAGELRWVLRNLGRLLVGVADQLGEQNDPGSLIMGHVTAALDAIDEAIGCVQTPDAC